MKRTFLLLFILLTGFASKAQFLDSIRASIDRKGSFTFSFNSRNSFISNQVVDIWGFMAGVCFDRKFSVGGGLNTLNSYLTRSETVEGQSIAAQLKFTYISYFAEYIIRLQRHWEVDIPISIGVGSSNYTYMLNGKQVQEDNKFIMPIEPQIEVDYDFLRNTYGNYCFGLYIQTGYRYMLINNNTINLDFNATTYSYGILLFPAEIYSALFPRSGLAHLMEGN